MSSNSVPGTNLNQTYSPELWAMESVAILFENAISARLVHRDFEPLFANFGDVVNTRKPSEAQFSRTTPGASVAAQAATATNIPVKLNQHLVTKFSIPDEEMSKSFKSLVEEFLVPHTIILARALDRVVLGQHVHFMSNQAGTIGGLTSSNAVNYISEAGLVMNRNNAHMDSRQQIWSPEAQSLIIQNSVFHEADKRGDTEGLRRASIGEKFNFTHWMDQNMSQIPGQTVVAGAINNGAGYPRGTTTLVVDGFTGVQVDETIGGNWLSINGKVYQALVGTSSGADTDGIVLTYGLLEAVADNDVVNVYPGALIDNAAGYATDYAGEILLDNGSGAVPPALTVGQILSFGANQNYTVIQVTVGATETSVMLDRPLELTLADNAPAFYGPGGGGVNFGFHRNALTLAVRPLAPPRQGTGAIAGIASFNGLTMRAIVSYDHLNFSQVVSLDFLAGVKVLDANLGVVTLT